MNSSPGISPGTSILLTGGAGFIGSHLAVRTGVRSWLAQPLLYERVSLQGTLGMLDLARRGMCRKFIFDSSSSVYGRASRVLFRKTTRRTGEPEIAERYPQRPKEESTRGWRSPEKVP